jgi:hypothetical protein
MHRPILLLSLTVASSMAAQGTLADYEGVYDYHGRTSLMIVAADTNLFAVIDEAKYPLRAIGGDRFLNAGGEQSQASSSVPCSSRVEHPPSIR